MDMYLQVTKGSGTLYAQVTEKNKLFSNVLIIKYSFE